MPWVMKGVVTLKTNIKKMTNVKLLKVGDEISFCLPATNQEALKAMAKNYGIEIPLLEDETVDWKKLDEIINYHI